MLVGDDGGDGSVLVTMDVNGTLYRGMLLAHSKIGDEP